jgi:hypothetical protein
VRELAALRRPAQERPAGNAAGPVHRHSASPRVPRLCRTARSGLQQMVSPTSAPTAKPGSWKRSASPSRTRPGTYGNPCRRRHGPYAARSAVAARRCRPPEMARSARQRPGKSQRSARPGSFSNRDGGVMARYPKGPDRLLTVETAAERMSTSVRFVRRLIAQRRNRVRESRTPRPHQRGGTR